MEDSTVFLDASRPDRRSAARTLGEPEVPSDASKQALTSTSSAALRRWAGVGGRSRHL